MDVSNAIFSLNSTIVIGGSKKGGFDPERGDPREGQGGSRVGESRIQGGFRIQGGIQDSGIQGGIQDSGRDLGFREGFSHFREGFRESFMES